MNREKIEISTIIVEDRQRLDYGDLDGLAASLKQYGLIQPIVLNQERRLIAGGRRLAAASLLCWTHIDVVFKETLSQEELHEYELEENVRRKAMSWQEECLTIAKIHSLRSQRSALAGDSWGQRQSAELFGIQVGTINYTLRVAKLLREEKDLPDDRRRAWKCDSASDCWRNVILADEETKLQAELSKQLQEEANKKQQETQQKVDSFIHEITTAKIEVTNDGDRAHIIALRQRASENYLSLNEQEARTLYLSNPLNPSAEFEKYYSEKRASLTEHFTVELTNNLILGDCLNHMRANEGRYDHIITDIPYGIDMEMLQQENTGMDVSTVMNEHDIGDNMSLMEKWFPLAFSCTKPTAFVVTWCDIMQWDFMYGLAMRAGFKVQRWPLVWRKLHTCMNQAAQFNYTKDFEIAMVCRKPASTIVAPQSTSVIAASNMEARKQYGHPFAKPSVVWDFLLDAVSIEGQEILEPFMGRGSGIIPMLRKKRKVVGVEINEAHYNAALLNVQQYYSSINPNFIYK